MNKLIPMISPQGKRVLVSQYDTVKLMKNGFKVADNDLVKWETSNIPPHLHPDDPMSPEKSAIELEGEAEEARKAAQAAAEAVERAEALAKESAKEAEAADKRKAKPRRPSKAAKAPKANPEA